MTEYTPCPQPGHKPDPIGRTGRAKVLLVVGDGAEVLDTLVPLYRLGEEYQVVVAGPEIQAYHLVIHERGEGWDITEERPGYRLETDAAFRDIEVDDYTGLVLPGGRAPEYLRYDSHLMGIVRSFFEQRKPVASICHGIEILATADVIRDRDVTTIPKCRFDAEICGAHYREEPVVRCDHLICARGKKDMSDWMKRFMQMLRESARA